MSGWSTSLNPDKNKEVNIGNRKFNSNEGAEFKIYSNRLKTKENQHLVSKKSNGKKLEKKVLTAEEIGDHHGSSEQEIQRVL